jgi:hypothetical protein
MVWLWVKLGVGRVEENTTKLELFEDGRLWTLFQSCSGAGAGVGAWVGAGAGAGAGVGAGAGNDSSWNIRNTPGPSDTKMQIDMRNGEGRHHQ